MRQTSRTLRNNVVIAGCFISGLFHGYAYLFWEKWLEVTRVNIYFLSVYLWLYCLSLFGYIKVSKAGHRLTMGLSVSFSFFLFLFELYGKPYDWSRLDKIGCAFALLHPLYFFCMYIYQEKTLFLLWIRLKHLTKTLTRKEWKL